MPRNFIRLAVALSLFASPLWTAAAGVVTVDDTIAGFDTRAHVSGLGALQRVTLHILSPEQEDTAIPVSLDASGSADVSIPAKLTSSAGRYRVFAVSGQTKLTADATFEIVTDRVDARRSTIVVADPMLPADGTSARIVTVTILDAQGNPLPGRPVQLVGSRVQDRITSLTGTRETDAQGRQQFALQTQAPGDISLRAMDLLSGTMLESAVQIVAVAAGGSAPVGGFANQAPVNSPSPFVGQVMGQQLTAATQQSYGVLTKFGVDVSTPNAKVKDVLPLVTISALDQNGRVVENFVGTVKIRTPNDSHSVLPGNFDDASVPVLDRFGTVNFEGKHRGVFPLAWVLSFTKPGQQTIAVADESGAVRGQAVVAVTGNADIPSGRKIQIDTPKEGEVENTRDIVVTGQGPALVNLSVWAGDGKASSDELIASAPVATGETDANGQFSILVTVPDAKDIVLEIQDETGQYDSGLRRMRLDTDGPAMQFTVSPEHPQEGTDIAITVQSEPGLPQVLLNMQDQEITLTETDPGTYQANLQAPGQGTTEFTIEASDAAGNVSEVAGSFDVAGPDLPVVQNLRAESLAGGVHLLWDSIPDPAITGYRIEVGRSPGRSDRTVEADTSGEFSVMELKAGVDYFFSVRAIRGNDQGPRSSTVTQRTLGMEISVTPQEGSLLLQWSFPDATPLASFTLEYGTTDGTYAEKRVLDGGMRVYTMDDLLPITYFIRLTPVSTTGIIMTELAVTTSGTPLTSSSFRTSGGGTFAGGNTTAPDNGLHSGAPNVPDVGFPGISVRLVLALTAVALGIYWYRRKKTMRETEEFLGRMQRVYRSP